MYRVTDAQIEYILNDIKQRSVEMEDLQNNLLDHVCCMLELNCKTEKDFETEYKKTIQQFFKTELWEIEEETILLLKYKHYYKMKRFLYILLFLSVSYNIFVFGRMGYELYKEREWMKGHMIDTKVTFENGLADLRSKLKEKYPSFKEKKYTCIYFLGGPMSDYEKERFEIEEDSSIYNPRKMKEQRLKEVKSIDSLAGLNSGNINHVFCFERNDKVTLDRMDEYSKVYKNLYYVADIKSLHSGYFNLKKSKSSFTPLIFIIDKNGKIVNETASISHRPAAALSKFFNKLEQ